MGILFPGYAQLLHIDIDEQAHNRALLETTLYDLDDFNQVDFSDHLFVQKPFQIPAYHLYQELWDTLHLRAQAIDIPFFKDTLKLMMVEHTNSSFAFPCSGNLVLDYGFHRKLFHAGVDFEVMEDAPIVSCFDGVVRMARLYGEYGKMVVIRHYNGLETVYAHLNRISVKSGQIVAAGQLIGTGGKTGNVDTPTLHFEIRFFNQFFNPNKVIDFKSRKLVDNLIVITPLDFNIVPIIKVETNSQGAINTLPNNKPKESPTFHIVKSGDTLFKIARLYNTTPEALIKLNNLKGDGSNIQLDQKIRIK
jgi:murein DD-endopeptidase MepM/ murein hydrolase activator NlpD